VSNAFLRRKEGSRAIRRRLLWLLLVGLPTVGWARPVHPTNRVTILYDAFGDRPGLVADWGFAALVEYGGKRILFDTGNDGRIFERNVRALGVDLKHLDFVVVSHRHGDHTGGLAYLLRQNPGVTIYAPREGFGVFGASLPASFLRRDNTLPPRMRYYGGASPKAITSGSPWPRAHFVWIDSLTEVGPGLAIVSTVSQTPGTLELRELSLAIRTPAGLVLVVGCSHPGIETIVAATQPFGEHVHMVFGGLHLVATPDPEIERIAAALHNRWKIDYLAPGHCTGEPAFDVLRRVFGDRYVYAGLGTAVSLSDPNSPAH
jgi:7,8-dihydropterin-6-yl-methyl-4-(beta-D-ribofuranosyl)aminobenzene 5'-phosphate synthase